MDTLRTQITVSRTLENDFGAREVILSLDDKPLATLHYGQSVTRDIEPGHHKLGGHNKLMSKIAEFDVQPGEHAHFVTSNQAGLGTWVGLLLLGAGSLHITLQPAMTRLRHILVGHNFFPDGEVAVSAAGVLAERTEAMLHVLHVIEPAPAYRHMPWPSHQYQTPQEELVDKLQAELKALAHGPDLAPLRVSTEVRIGKPFVELIAACRRWPADLIVVGASPRGEGRLLGSTADRVLRKSPVPVLVAKQRLAKTPKTILVPTDFSSCAQKAAEEGVALAHTFGSRAVFVHVLEHPYVYSPAYGMAQVLTPADIEPEWREFLHPLPLGGGLVWEKRTCEGRAAETIVTVAREIGADLIVMGTHGRGALAHMLLGSVAETVVRTAPCSVLAIRPDALRFELP